MIQQENSLVLMNQIDSMQKDIKDIKQTTVLLEEQIKTKLAILDTYEAITTSMLASIEDIEEKTRTQDSIVFALDTDRFLGDAFSFYGHTIHPQLAGLSDQMFNFLTSTGPLFKDNVSVSFSYDINTMENGEQVSKTVTDKKYQYCDLLKYETDDSKQDVFQIFPTNQIKMTVELNPTNLIGNTQCNMIEICPYLPGTFTINEIRGWTIEQYLSGELTDEMIVANPPLQAGPYVNVGPERICLDNTYQLYRIEFDITIHTENTEVQGYPFGLRHLYFYNAKMDKQNSYVIGVIKKDKYVNTIGDSVTVTTPEGKKPYQPTEDDDLKFYAVYENGMLQGKLTVGSPLARNLKTIYVKIPIKESIKAITFNNIQTRV